MDGDRQMMPPPPHPAELAGPSCGDLAATQAGGDSPYCHLANFEIEKKIGRGQFSVVYRAKCIADGQVMALKKVQVVYKGLCPHISLFLYFSNLQ